MAEKLLYEPVKAYLLTQFSHLGDCEFEITEKELTERVKRWLDTETLLFHRVERKLPDLMGRLTPKAGESAFLNPQKGLIVVEVKKAKPKLKDIYQTKMYAEVFNAPYALLISSNLMIEEMKRLLNQRPELISYSPGQQRIYFGRYDRLEGTILEKDWYPHNPFRNGF